jgi:hypothetical protein
MKYAENRYRIVETHDRNTTVRTFVGWLSAQAYTIRRSGLEIQRATEAEDGSVFDWQPTSFSLSPTKFSSSIR